MEHAEPILKIRLFQAFGIELEYMIVDQDTLNVLPISDKLFHAVTGEYLSEVEEEDVSWCNELSLHLVELKITDPSPTLKNLEKPFQSHVKRINKLLKQFNARLMPSGMHPWMNPRKELKLWPHEYHEIYETYHRIFDCRGHGWANLQSTHVNLPFANNSEFAQLHAAIRILLPIMPALAASSPIVEGKATGLLDNRMHVYQNNSASIPSITGKVIPESSSSQNAYEKNILNKIYQDILPFDPEKILRHEWCNARGAIARFDRFTIEIRILDIQECPKADLAIVQAIVAALKALISEKWIDMKSVQEYPLENLYKIFLACVKAGESTVIKDKSFLQLFGYPSSQCRANELWHWIIEETFKMLPPLKHILDEGTLATRILKAWNEDQTKEGLRYIYRQLCDCLDKGKLF